MFVSVANKISAETFNDEAYSREGATALSKRELYFSTSSAPGFKSARQGY